MSITGRSVEPYKCIGHRWEPQFPAFDPIVGRREGAAVTIVDRHLSRTVVGGHAGAQGRHARLATTDPLGPEAYGRGQFHRPRTSSVRPFPLPVETLFLLSWTAWSFVGAQRKARSIPWNARVAGPSDCVQTSSPEKR